MCGHHRPGGLAGASDEPQIGAIIKLVGHLVAHRLNPAHLALLGLTGEPGEAPHILPLRTLAQCGHYRPGGHLAHRTNRLSEKPSSHDPTNSHAPQATSERTKRTCPMIPEVPQAMT